MSAPKNILIAGSSGMVGNELLKICLESKEINKIYLLSRNLSIHKNPKVPEIIINDFLNYNVLSSIPENIDVVFFCIGVYTGATEKSVFQQITVDYPVALAREVIVRWPSSKFILLSGAGADRSEKSRVLFAKYKGIAENQLYQLFKSNFHSARPGYIYPVTKRKEPNFMYRVFRLIYPIIKCLGKKLSITSVQLAKAMLVMGVREQHQTGFENDEMIKLALGFEKGM
jgi:nucleoside-diphosphate-sugar epimerase